MFSKLCRGQLFFTHLNNTLAVQLFGSFPLAHLYSQKLLLVAAISPRAPPKAVEQNYVIIQLERSLARISLNKLEQYDNYIYIQFFL